MLGDLVWIDLLRLVVATAALLLAALVARLGWIRWRRGGFTEETSHPATYASYALALVTLGFLRLAHLTEPVPTIGLYPTTAVVALGWWGVTRRARFTTRPPHRR